MYTHTIYDRIFGDFPAKNTVHTLYTYGSGQLYLITFHKMHRLMLGLLSKVLCHYIRPFCCNRSTTNWFMISFLSRTIDFFFFFLSLWIYLWLAETSQQPISQTTWLKVTPHCNHCNHYIRPGRTSSSSLHCSTTSLCCSSTSLQCTASTAPLLVSTALL